MNIIFAFCLFLLPCREINSVCIEGIKKSYSTKDKIDLIVHNNTNDSIICIVGAEVYIQNKWSEFINDVKRPMSKSSELHKIISNNKLKISFKADEIHLISRHKGNSLYRIKIVVVSLHNSDKEQYYFSNPFTVKK